jgi:protein phosphatase 2C family protein 2/3
MSHDHKPVNKEEAARITAAGGFVEYGRVNGNLALSRAVGDFEFKQNFSLDAEHQAVTVNPDVIVHEWTGEEEFLVVACDGIWDCLSSQQVVDFTRRAIANGDSLTKIAEDMMEKCLAPDSELGGVGCDNMTVVVVALLHGKTEDEWRSWVKQRVEDNVGYTTPESVPDVFKTPPVSTRAATTPTANGVPATGSGSTAGARKQGGSSLAELLQGGGLGGVDLKQLLAGTGINLSAGGLLSGQGEDDEEDEDDDDEDEVRFLRSIGHTSRTQTNIVRPLPPPSPAGQAVCRRSPALRCLADDGVREVGRGRCRDGRLDADQRLDLGLGAGRQVELSCPTESSSCSHFLERQRAMA